MLHIGDHEFEFIWTLIKSLRFYNLDLVMLKTLTSQDTKYSACYNDFGRFTLICFILVQVSDIELGINNLCDSSRTMLQHTIAHSNKH